MNIFDLNVQRYESWFENNSIIFQNEVRLLKSFVDPNKFGLEIGVGTGRFASLLGTKIGLDISKNMLLLAKKRGIEVVLGRGEEIPFKDESFDYVTIIVTICFVDDPLKVLKEAGRILKENGKLFLAFIEYNSKYGEYYRKIKEESIFYKVAKFYSRKEIEKFLLDTNFRILGWAQTLFREPVVQVEENWLIGNDKGSFLLVEAEKSSYN